MKVVMNYAGNRGYGTDQVRGMPLSVLLTEVKQAIDDYGEDAEVVLRQGNQTYGAKIGELDHWDLFTASDDEES